LAGRFGTLFLIGPLTNLPPGEIHQAGQNSIPPKLAEISGIFSPQTALTLRRLSSFSQFHSIIPTS
jgi:hypothetical protein